MNPTLTTRHPSRSPHHRVGSLCATIALALLLGSEATAQRRFTRSEEAEAPASTEAAATRKRTPKITDDAVTAIINGDVHLGTGQVLSRGQVLIKDGKIQAVGHDLEVPEGATVVDATGKVVCPGFVSVADAAVGRSGWRSGPGLSNLNPYDPSMKRALAAGITSFLTGSARSTGKPGGKTKVVKCAFGELDHMLLAENTIYGMRTAMDPKQWRDFEKLVQDSKQYLADLKAYEQAALAAAQSKGPPAKEGEKKDDDKKQDAPKKPKAPGGSGPLLAVLKGEAQLWIEGAGNQAGLDRAVQIAELLDTGVVIQNSAIAWTAADRIARTGSMAIVPPRLKAEPDPTNPESTGSTLAAAAILAKAGVTVAVTTPPGGYGAGGIGTNGLLGQDLNTLHVDAAFAIRGGLPRRDALRTITLDAARVLGIDDRVGSLEPGKDADVLICSGPPLHYATFADTVMINGKVVYNRFDEPFYKDVGKRVEAPAKTDAENSGPGGSEAGEGSEGR